MDGGRHDRHPKLAWGSGLWAFLHTVTLVDHTTTWEAVSRQTALVRHVRAMVDVLPCSSCAKHYREMLLAYPPELAAQRPLGLFEWTVMVHNTVNARLGVPQVSLETALRMWRGGGPE